MSRVSLHIEDHPAGSIAVLRINGQQLRLTQQEFEGLAAEVIWAKPILYSERTYHSAEAVAAYDAEQYSCGAAAISPKEPGNWVSPQR